MDGDGNDCDQCFADAATTIFTTTAEGTVKRCGVVTGDDLTSLLAAAAKDANAHTPWTSGGTEYHLILRPLLPDEHGC